MNEDFFLRSALARRLYHECAAGLPIIDYHCHLPPGDLAEDRSYRTLTDLWIAGDPYKHRAMRMAGVPEALITGTQASPRERFDVWAATVPKTVGNPLHHWTALELARVFDIRAPLSPQTADAVWEEANAKLRLPEYSARRLLGRFNVEAVCTSDGLLDDLAAHEMLAGLKGPFRVLPSLRGDDLLVREGGNAAARLRRLAASTGVVIDSFEVFRGAVVSRLDAFEALGCRLADHALDTFDYVPTDSETARRLFARHAAGEALSPADAVCLNSAILRFLGGEYGRRGWIMQLHLGAQRHTSTRLRKLAGPAGGYAAIGACCDVGSLCAFLDDLEQCGLLPRTVLYTLNPAHSAALASLTGSYAEDGVAGKVQFGPAWWYNDHALGIRQHLDVLASYGLLSTFIGMTTDSRNLLSFVRHEYFRRVLCDTLGEWVERGLVPNDFDGLASLTRAVCYGNAKAMTGL